MSRFGSLYVVVNLINQKGEEEESGIVIKKVHDDDDVDIVVFSFFSSLLVVYWSLIDRFWTWMTTSRIASAATSKCSRNGYWRLKNKRENMSYTIDSR